MKSISSFLLIEVKGKDISLAEEAADFFLTPARYLLNGKRVELVQRGQETALSSSASFSLQERSWKKALFMTACLFPGALIGSILKSYSYYRNETSCRMQETITAHMQSNSLVSSKSETLKKTVHLLRTYLGPQKRPPSFFQKITYALSGTSAPALRQSIFNLRSISLKGQTRYKSHAILHNIDLLYNLKEIDLHDYFCPIAPSSRDDQYVKKAVECLKTREELFIKAKLPTSQFPKQRDEVKAPAKEFFSKHGQQLKEYFNYST